ncbi:hypothetical protein SAMN05444581_102298 [Methylocapsa palsarum]|uniref:Uncharacterized protein n=1 Tax=Methylocapsa palsarum TaxID=1612308 RepID=A0A1I3X132_9HYPH|nr:hypothetical protein SAMN05444581_102298 [Methylocapsa palsarum]
MLSTAMSFLGLYRDPVSHALLVGAILHVLYAGADKTLAGVAAFLSDPKRPIESRFLIYRGLTRLSPPRGNSCKCTRTICPAGKAPVKSAELPAR